MPTQRSMQSIAELKEFAALTAAEQRYIARSLEVAANGAKAARRWARGVAEAAAIGRQAEAYRSIGHLKARVLKETGNLDVPDFLPALIDMSTYDLRQGKLISFAAYRFLYERLLGAAVRPWLLSAFSCAAALPCLHPSHRAELMGSITVHQVATIGWTNREATFVPEWVEKVSVAVL